MYRQKAVQRITIWLCAEKEIIGTQKLTRLDSYYDDWKNLETAFGPS